MHAISASIWKMRNANCLILQIVCDKRAKKKISPKIPKYCERRDIDINEILRSKRLHFWHLEAISKSWLQVRKAPILFLFGINLPLKKPLISYFYKNAIAGSSLLRSLGWPKKRQRSGSARWGALCWMIVVVICGCDLWLWLVVVICSCEEHLELD